MLIPFLLHGTKLKCPGEPYFRHPAAPQVKLIQWKVRLTRATSVLHSPACLERAVCCSAYIMQVALEAMLLCPFSGILLPCYSSKPRQQIRRFSTQGAEGNLAEPQMKLR